MTVLQIIGRARKPGRHDRVIDRDGADLGLMIVAEAQKRASEQGAELFVIERTAKPPVVRIVEVRKMRME